MVRVIAKSLDYYVTRIQAHLLKKYPELEFKVVSRSPTWATIYYRPYVEKDDYAIIKRASNLMTDAVIEGYSINLVPST